MREKLGIKDVPLTPPTSIPSGVPGKLPGHITDIKTFVAGKAPTNDNEFVATVAYYYQFEASDSERKDSIGKDEVVDACRKSLGNNHRDQSRLS